MGLSLSSASDSVLSSVLSSVSSGAGRTVINTSLMPSLTLSISSQCVPQSLPVLEKLGVRRQVEEIGVLKRGAEFVSQYHEGDSVTFYFKGARDKKYPIAYQVRRSEFDHILLKNSKEKGTEVLEGVRVTGVDLNSNGKPKVTAENENGQTLEWEARYVVDASGRDSFLAK